MLPQILHWGMTKTPTWHPARGTERRVRAGLVRNDASARASAQGYITISLSCTNVTFA